MESQGPIKIDLSAVLKQRLGAKSWLIPSFAVRKLERLICQEQMNDILQKTYPKRGADFCDAVLDYLGVTVDVDNADLLPPSPRVIIVSNHPLGGLDGICLLSVLSKHYGQPVKCVVNDLLSAVEPLSDCFIPINKHGSQNRKAVKALDEAFAADGPVVVFPAGLVSRLGTDGKVADLQWNKMFVSKAIETGRPVVPVFFNGKNSPGFYSAARRRVKLGLKFNYEMILLPREIFRNVNSRFVVSVGRAIDPSRLKGGKDASASAAFVRNLVYQLSQK